MKNHNKEKTGRGIDTVYRINLRNYVNLIKIADGKAGIIISINSLILSIIITAGAVLIGKGNFSDLINTTFIWPILIFILTIFTTLLFAIISVIPKIQDSCVINEEIKSHKVSLVFYNHFLKMTSEEFVLYMRELKKDPDDLYDSLSRDLYGLGKLLRKKYRLLNLSYWILIGGWILTIVVFGISCI